jgi:tRNA threonylcarbamoyladenosine biosynthesis protein TsaB
MSVLLCLDSSTPCGSVALCRDGQVLAEVTLDVSGKTHSDYLLRYTDFLLNETGLTLSAVDGFGVVAGPGSFTGLRVGLATVQGLALASQRPVYPVSSLDVVAFANGSSDLPVMAVIDARKREVYAARYVWQNGLPCRCSDERVISPAALIEELTEKTLFVGNGVVSYREQFDVETHEHVVVSADLNLVPKAGAVGVLLARSGAKIPPVDPFHLHPVYIRPSDAELHHNGRKV